MKEKPQNNMLFLNSTTLMSVTSVAANYRAACRARSKKEFHSKICIVVEEADETLFWLELISELNLLDNIDVLNQLMNETEQVLKVVAKAKNTNYET